MVADVGSFMKEGTFVTKYYEDDIHTAAKSAAVNATFEEWALITAINVALTAAGKTNLPTTKRMRLEGTMVVTQAGATGPEYAQWYHGDLADADPRGRQYTTGAGAETTGIPTILYTDETGNVGIKVQTVANITLTFYLEAAAEIQTVEA